MSNVDRLSLLTFKPDVIKQALWNTVLPAELGITAVGGVRLDSRDLAASKVAGILFGDPEYSIPLQGLGRDFTYQGHVRPLDQLHVSMPNGSGQRLFNFFQERLSGPFPANEHDDVSFSAYISGTEPSAARRDQVHTYAYGEAVNPNYLNAGGHYALRNQLEELRDGRLPHFVAITNKDALTINGASGSLMCVNAAEFADFHGPVDVVPVNPQTTNA